MNYFDKTFLLLLGLKSVSNERFSEIKTFGQLGEKEKSYIG